METKKLAKYAVHRAIEMEKRITNMNLNKLLYVMQVEWLKRYNRYLIEEQFEAEQWGPSLSSVYYEYCGHGGMPIWTHPKDVKPDMSQDMTDEQIRFIDELIGLYAERHPWDYEPEYFGEGSVFQKILKDPTVMANRSRYNHPVIPNALIAESIRGDVLFEDRLPVADTNKKTVEFRIPSQVKYFCRPLYASFDNEALGLRANHVLFHWDIDVAPAYKLSISIIPQGNDKPLETAIHLDYMGIVADYRHTCSLDGVDMTLRHNDFECLLRLR